MKKAFTVTLNGDLLAYAERMVAEGAYASVEDMLAAALDDLKFDQEAAARQAMEGAGLDELKRRLATPADEFAEWDGDAARARLNQRYRRRVTGNRRAAE